MGTSGVLQIWRNPAAFPFPNVSSNTCGLFCNLNFILLALCKTALCDYKHALCLNFILSSLNEKTGSLPINKMRKDTKLNQKYKISFKYVSVSLFYSCTRCSRSCLLGQGVHPTFWCLWATLEEEEWLGPHITHTVTRNHKKSHNVLSKFTILCWAAFTATLSRRRPAACGLDTPGTAKTVLLRTAPRELKRKQCHH